MVAYIRLFRFFWPPEGAVLGVNLAAACMTWWLMQLWTSDQEKPTPGSMDVGAPAA